MSADRLGWESKAKVITTTEHPTWRKVTVTSWLALLAMLLALAPPATAKTLDEAARALQRGQRVYDFADVLSRPEEQRLQDQLEALEQEGVAQGTIVVIDRLEDATIQEFALGIGERWKVGRRDVDNGFVLAVSIGDRRWWLEVGRDLQGAIPDAAATRLTRDTLVTPFRQGRYGEGLQAAVAALEQRLQEAGGVEALPVREPEPGPSGAMVLLTLLLGGLTVVFAFQAWPRGVVPGRDPWRLPAIGSGYGALGAAVLGASQAPTGGAALMAVGLIPGAWALVRTFEGSWTPYDLSQATRAGQTMSRAYWAVIAVGTIWWLFVAPSGMIVLFLLLAVPSGLALRGYFSRIPRKCPECTGALRWLPEAEEPEVLKDVEDLEQRLGSVEYDIWRCNNCDRSAVFAHERIFAPYKKCPRCHRRTLTSRTVMDEQPTAWQDGWASDVTECKNPRCNYRDVTRQRRVERGGYRDDGFGGIIIIPPIIGGWGGHGGHGGSGGGDWGGGGFDVGDFGGGGGFDGGGGGGDW